MRQTFRWMTVALCCVVGAAAGETRPDARLEEARHAWEEARTLSQAGNHTDAIARAQHALALQEAVLGKEHLAVADALDKLGGLYEAQGLYPEDRLVFPPELLNENWRAASQFGHALNVLRQGKSAPAMRFHERALKIRETVLGENHPDVARSLQLLADLDYTHGAYGTAEISYDRALALRKAALGENHLEFAESLDGLANLYLAQGFFFGAGRLHSRALAIRVAALGKSHPDVAASLHHLGDVYLGQGKYPRAESLYTRALGILQLAHGENPSQVAGVLDSLAVLYMRQGMYARAEPLFARAITLQETALGKKHHRVATVLAHRALLHAYQEQYERAEPLLERALAMREAALGKNHPLVATCLRELARLRLAQHRFAEAVPLLTRALSISESRLRLDVLGASESRLASALWQLRDEEELLYALVRAAPDDEGVRRLALTAALLRKGRSAAELTSISRSNRGPLGASEQPTLERLNALRSEFATLSLQNRGSLQPAEYQQRLRNLTAVIEALETNLARGSALERIYSTEAPPRPEVVIDRVTQGLPEHGALIEFITCTEGPALPRPGTADTGQPGQSYYLALVLLPNAEVRAVELGPVEPIDRAASLLRDALARRDADFQPLAQALYKLAFRPLLPLLGNARRLFLSPDGQLGLVPFAALHDGRRFLVDSFDFTYLTSGRDLIPRLLEEWTPATSVTVLADPAFTPIPGSMPPNGPAGQFWIPLPGTRQEAEAIQRLIPRARLLLGTKATKEQLLHQRAPGVLHLATHGFFLSDEPAREASRAVGHFGALGEGVLMRLPPDPLLRSGLVLADAGAAAPASSSAAQARPYGGWVTALELAGIDLWGTQLVILSACDTGRGDVRQGQGVYGLRRALILAGAETVVMSLWMVRDDTTSQIMEAYYRNLLEGQGRAVALRNAMRTLREKHPHPHFWAPFIVLGRDTPLSGFGPAPAQAPKP
ncbi:hypothetical protein D187_009046 [Cystobacter fuscus DSM 2262]|uniref:CHAT domain-containing protein n=1 Tax=Cystobacter fuscus (strain ATCC 25194 / DSM 2262 / NBRC 100088 / M29) TaxID=1242864 RepID=S9NTG5_CYSF2|nr:CHAT domain-containing tetratricopeptide repeat protein [Cystobacter fuscus]EPX55435.1 hypothetical protein D187_009046 [Cystobacter fuscus DSM 2262]